VGQAQIKVATKRDRGYAASRRAYDRRRRSAPLDDDGRQYKRLVQRDPCSYCRSGDCGQVAADHIVALGKGGMNRWDNLTAAGRACNAAKKDKDLLLFLLEGPR
jgi:5-methylcytosine-specific restriction endonuclease McrA